MCLAWRVSTRQVRQCRANLVACGCAGEDTFWARDMAAAALPGQRAEGKGVQGGKGREGGREGREEGREGREEGKRNWDGQPDRKRTGFSLFENTQLKLFAGDHSSTESGHHGTWEQPWQSRSNLKRAAQTWRAEIQPLA